MGTMISCIITTWLMSCFVTLEPNPMNWTAGGRGFYLVLTIGIFVMCCILEYEAKDEE